MSSGGGQPAGVVGGEHVSHTSNKRLNAPCIRLRHHPHHSCLHDPLRPQDHPRTTPGPGTPNPSPPNPHPVRHDTQHHPPQPNMLPNNQPQLDTQHRVPHHARLHRTNWPLVLESHNMLLTPVPNRTLKPVRPGSERPPARPDTTTKYTRQTPPHRTTHSKHTDVNIVTIFISTFR